MLYNQIENKTFDQERTFRFKKASPWENVRSLREQYQSSEKLESDHIITKFDHCGFLVAHELNGSGKRISPPN